MIRMQAVLQVKVGERLYSLHCEPDSPLPELKDVIDLMHNHVVKLIDDAIAKQNEQKSNEVENG